MERKLPPIVYLILLGRAQSPPPSKHIPAFLLRFKRGSFVYPVEELDCVTEKNDWGDEWYNSQDFTENRYLGEDWNKTTDGDTDCEEPVYSTATGVIVSANDAGPGWGKVVMIEHTAENGSRLRSL